MKKTITLCFLAIIGVLKAQQVIVIDPGHGYDSGGGNPDGRTATEINTALEVGLRLKTLLNTECPAWTVHLTRTIPNGWISVSQRASMSNSWGGDYYLSIHGNAGGGSGTETFWCNVSDGSSTDDIAFANAIQNKMTTHGHWISRRVVEDYSYLNYDLGVLSQSNATGCLNEVGFVDSGDATKLNSSAWRDSFALAYKKALFTIIGACSDGSVIPTPTATNDYCGTEIQLQSTNACNLTHGTLNGSTSSFPTLQPSCDNLSSGSKKDVFYYFNAQATTHTVTVKSYSTTSSGIDAVVAVYTGSVCNSSNLTEIACADVTGTGATETIQLNNLTIGDRYLIRLYDYGTIDPTNPEFDICVTHNGITTNLASVNTNSDLHIFPNPNNGVFTIQKPNDLETINYKIYNSIGQEIEHNSLTQNETQVSLINQPAGVYILTAQLKNGATKNYKLLKN